LKEKYIEIDLLFCQGLQVIYHTKVITIIKIELII